MSENFGCCPHCWGESDGTVMYSNPSQTRCSECGKTWSYGPGIVVIAGDEAILRRPKMHRPDEVEAAKSRLTPWKEQFMREREETYGYFPLVFSGEDGDYAMIGEEKVPIDDLYEFMGRGKTIEDRYR